MKKNLVWNELLNLLQSAFGLQPGESSLSILVDLPDDRLPDTDAWQDRREIAVEWWGMIREHMNDIPFRGVHFCAYPNVGSNNNELPPVIGQCAWGEPVSFERSQKVPLEDILRDSSVVLAMTELSATAPLKNSARKYAFRGATLPGFTRRMIPALVLNLDEVHLRVTTLKNRLDEAIAAHVIFTVGNDDFHCSFDLRFRTAHSSSGIQRTVGSVGNLPSGEAYITPYEGERSDIESNTSGVLPVQFGTEVVIYTIKHNRVVMVAPGGPEAEREWEMVRQEPAYGNIAELGFGVLGEWGISAVGSTLLDEKLGFHVAFGRSDHFGGMTGPGSFRKSDHVVHIDWVYVPSCQPAITVKEVKLQYPDHEEVIIREGAYCV